MSPRNPALLVVAALLGLPCAHAEASSPRPAGPAAPSTAAVSQDTPDPEPNRVDYVIEARLDGETKVLEASETITWTNNTGVATSELYFHTYLNAFSNNRTTFAVEGGARHKKGEWGWQQVTAVRVDGDDVFETFEHVDPDPALVLTITEGDPFLQEDDRSVFRVTLGAPVESGQTVAIDLAWTSQLPRVRRRTGYKDDFLLVAQWFPKLGVFEGERGWNCHQFHNNTEFYSDYGTYRVTLDLPDIYSEKVGGSGVQVTNRKKDGDRVEVVFEAPSIEDRERPDMFGKLPLVHDFTWTGDPKYVVDEYSFNFDEWSVKSDSHAAEVERVAGILGPDVPIALRDVAVTVLIHPERRGQSQRHYEATANALFFYGLWFGEYPYEHITVVDPVWGDNRAGGMEYPTLFTAGTALFTTPDMHRPESVTIHEAGHQFWYGLVGNNEFEGAWLDEGFNSYTDSEAIYRAYGPRRSTTSYSRYPFNGVRPSSLPDGGNLGAALNARRWRWSVGLLSDLPVVGAYAKKTVTPIRSTGVVDWWRDQPLLTLVSRWDDPRWSDRSGYLSAPDSDPIDRPAWTYVDRSSYGTNSYRRPAVALRSLAGVVGYDDFLRGMRAYAKEWRYRHPYPDDFFETFNEAVGEDLSWYWEDAFRSVKTIDWSVGVRQSSISDPKGFFQGEDGAYVEYEAPKKAGDDEEETDEAAAEEEVAADAQEEPEVEGAPGKPKKPYLIEITLRRKGELCLPLPWRLIYSDDTFEDLVWSREAQLEQPWWKYRVESSKKVKAVVLDPDRAYYFDKDMTDNQWFDAGDDVAPLRWTERVLNQYGHLLHWYGGIGG